MRLGAKWNGTMREGTDSLVPMSQEQLDIRNKKALASTRRVFCGAWWRFGRVNACRPEGRGLESRSRHHVGTLGKSFTHSCLWCFGVKFRHSIRAVSGAPLSSRGLEEAL